MRSRLESWILAVTAALVLTGCASAPRVDVARSPEAHFDRYRTFSFYQPLGTDRQEGTGTILSQTLKRSARAELEQRGYTYVTDNADLEVNFFIETRQVLHGVQRPGFGISYGMFHHNYGVWSGYDTTELHQYTEGTLHVDVIDADANQLVWEAVAVSSQPDDNFAFEPGKAEQAVRRVFADFPRQSAPPGS